MSVFMPVYLTCLSNPSNSQIPGSESSWLAGLAV